MLSLRDTAPAPRSAPPRRSAQGRRPFRDNPILIVASIALLIAALGATLTFASRSSRLSPDFLTEFVLYALSAADLAMILALVFVLARNIVKMMVERRRGLPFARFRSKLVAVLLALTLIPSMLVLFVGSELIRSSLDRWFNAPMEEIVASANRTAADYYRERQKLVSDTSRRIGRVLSPLGFPDADVTKVFELISPEVAQQRIGMVEVYRVSPGRGPRPDVLPVAEVRSPSLPPDYNRASADRLAERVVAENTETHAIEPLGSGGELVRAASPVRGNDGAPAAVIVASDFLTGEMSTRARRMTESFEQYNQLRVLRNPLIGVYISFFLMVTLMILVSATWMGLYLAKRITRPIQRLAAAAREIGAGHLDHRLEPETSDEFGALVEAFNTMAGELWRSRRDLERSAGDQQRQHQEVEARRRYIETILERITTGVISLDASGHVTTINSAAARLLALDGQVATGRPAVELLSRPDLQPLVALVEGARQEGQDPPPQEIGLAHDGRELHLAAAATALHGEGGAIEGTVLVFDDITPLIRAQKVAAWREVARRLAHEIKNPLTPIQLCAERLGRHFQTAPPPTRALVEECTKTIVGEVESLKALVDEFSQFARMPAPRRIPTDLAGLLADTLSLYVGLFREVKIESTAPPGMPMVRVDPEQIRRVVINLVDNAIEAMDRHGHVAIEVQYAATERVARVVVADNGPGIPASEREKLFLPYYSTKRRGSGLGLAIVRRIIAEHGGTIDVADNAPTGTRFTIELPA
ncbi:MAG TPA: ATP-binding protein [Vicinamibacterales bacterium]|jgi:two-component system nitrogen regulation sensor histidine kinase NtrY